METDLDTIQRIADQILSLYHLPTVAWLEPIADVPHLSPQACAHLDEQLNFGEGVVTSSSASSASDTTSDVTDASSSSSSSSSAAATTTTTTTRVEQPEGEDVGRGAREWSQNRHAADDRKGRRRSRSKSS